jgi:hypothetical protein
MSGERYWDSSLRGGKEDTHEHFPPVAGPTLGNACP